MILYKLANGSIIRRPPAKGAYQQFATGEPLADTAVDEVTGDALNVKTLGQHDCFAAGRPLSSFCLMLSYNTRES